MIWRVSAISKKTHEAIEYKTSGPTECLSTNCQERTVSDKGMWQKTDKTTKRCRICVIEDLPLNTLILVVVHISLGSWVVDRFRHTYSTCCTGPVSAYVKCWLKKSIMTRVMLSVLGVGSSPCMRDYPKALYRTKYLLTKIMV